jgi:hypothetical protein
MANVIALLAALLIAAPPQPQAQAPSPEEVKAAFLYHFGAFVEWPAQPRAERMVIGVMGDEAIEAEVRRITAGRRIQERPVTVRRIEPGADLSGVHVLYVGPREPPQLARIARAAAGHPVLVVTDQPDGLEYGGVVNFVTADRVQFEISLDAAARAGLRLSPRLLSVAVRVKKGETATPLLALKH